MLLEDARLGSPRFSPWPAGRPALLGLRPCWRLFDTDLQAIDSLVGTLPGASFCRFCGRLFGTLPGGLFCGTLSGTPSSSYNLSSGSFCFCMVVGFSWRLSCVSNHSTRSASANQCRAMSLNASLTLGMVLCAARCLAASPRRR
jgi:hypothetical protein